MTLVTNKEKLLTSLLKLHSWVPSLLLAEIKSLTAFQLKILLEILNLRDKKEELGDVKFKKWVERYLKELRLDKIKEDLTYDKHILTCVNCGVKFERDARKELDSILKRITGPFCSRQCIGKKFHRSKPEKLVSPYKHIRSND